MAALNLKIPPRDLKSKDSRHLLSLICTQWLSLSTCIIQAVIDIVPAPHVAQAIRVPKMFYPDLYETTLAPKNKLEEDLFSSNSSATACVTAYVSKMFAVPAKDLPENKKTMTTDSIRTKAREARAAREARDHGSAGSEAATSSVLELNSQENQLEEKEIPLRDAEVILGFARLYSGTLRTGACVFAVLPKYNNTLEPTHPHNAKFRLKVNVEGLYIMMGRELVVVDHVRAGNIFAIRGLEGKVWRNATLCAPGESGIDDTPNLSELGPCIINLGAVRRSVSAYISK